MTMNARIEHTAMNVDPCWKLFTDKLN